MSGQHASSTAPSELTGKARFTALWNRCMMSGRDSNAESIHDLIVERYSEPHRRYHTLNHIEHCLRQFDTASQQMDNADAVELSIWFHDVIYELGADDNEQRSADLLMDVASNQLPGALARNIYDLIMVTRHCDTPASKDACFMVDIDLSSFGRPWNEFKRDSDAVRMEFPDKTDAEFYAGKMNFLGCLLDRPHFCFSGFFRDCHEDRAQSNIKRMMQEIERNCSG